MKTGRSRRWLLLSALPILLAVLVIGARFAAPGIARARLIAMVNHDCPGCTLQIGAIEASPLCSGIHVSNIHYRTDGNNNVRVDVRVARIDVALTPLSFFRSLAHIQSIVVTGVRLAVTEDVWPERRLGMPDPRERPSPILAIRPLLIDHLVAHDVQIVFTDRIAAPPDSPPAATPTIASMTFGPFSAHTEGFATRHGHSAPVLITSLEGHLSGPGLMQLILRFDPLESTPAIAIDFRGMHQDLHPFESYALPAEGIHLRGLVDEASGTLRYAHEAGSLHFGGTFRHLDLRLTPTPRRGPFVTGLGNLQVAVTIARANDEMDQDQRSVNIRLDRREGEPLPGFLWSLVRAAILQLATMGRHTGEVAEVTSAVQ